MPRPSHHSWSGMTDLLENFEIYKDAKYLNRGREITMIFALGLSLKQYMDLINRLCCNYNHKMWEIKSVCSCYSLFSPEPGAN
jgi:hypothetical protein